MPKITREGGPSNAAAALGEPGYMPEPGEAAAEPPDPTPGPARASTPPPPSPPSSAPKAARAAPSLTGRKAPDG